ncbi:MAG TPA: L-histidine N(alpha)-methyltransferase [Desulfuromonadaceae bacterium]|nr:L-histidine N(alpha)-methyltransferase [Desulfuromonadaceae bacterium]
MDSAANILVHESQFPGNVHRDLLDSLRRRQVNHKFHYDSVKQTQKWLALHQQFSPSRHDADCRRVYDQSFVAAASAFKTARVRVVGLGCGGGQKDTRLLKLLKRSRKEVFYTPCDVSAAMVLTARETALSVLPPTKCFPVVCDLASANSVRSLLATRHPTLVTFFGMIPNFEPQDILPKLASLLKPSDVLLFSANLAPGPDYRGGIRKILPQYDNPATRDWLMTFLMDLGVEAGDGKLGFDIETRGTGLKQVVARFRFKRARTVSVDRHAFRFAAGQDIRLFFSYRYTADRIQKMLGRYGLRVEDQWVARSQEEGVFLCRKRR